MNTVQFFRFLALFIGTLGSILYYLILLRIIISWANMGRPRPKGPITTFVDGATDPVINTFKLLPHRLGMLDLSPIYAFFAIQYVTDFFNNLATVI